MSNKKSKKERLRRLLALILVIFMAGSVFTSVIYYLAVSISADSVAEIPDGYDLLLKVRKRGDKVETDAPDTEEKSDTEDTEEESEDDALEAEESEENIVPADEYDIEPADDDKLIRVGLMYGTGVTQGFEVTTPYGFCVNKVNRTDDLTSEPIWELDITKISCTVDHNLSKSGMTYSKTWTEDAVRVGGYHAEIEGGLTREEAEDLIDYLEPTLDELGVYAIPSYIDGGFTIRAGHFGNRLDAELLAEEIAEEHPDFSVGVAVPTDTAVSVVDPLTDKILFEYDDGDVTAIGFTALESPEGDAAYLVTPAKKLYDGTFMFRRYISGNTDGVSLTDILPLGEYIKGVLPYEISSSWPLEAQKAFAICVRSYTLAGVRHESAYQVDLCNSTHCQVYGGRTKVTDTVERAVDETEGLVMTSGGKIVTAYYSAVTGGVTVNVEDAWGGRAQSYLVAVQTPWENYTTHSEGAWSTEVSGKELLEYLSGTKGYTSLKGEIKDIRIDQLAKNSTYIYKITFIDSYGTEVTVKTTDGVRTALSKYVNSSNFVVGKGSVTTQKTEFIPAPTDKLNAATQWGDFRVDTDAPLSVITAYNTEAAEIESSHVLTARGKFSLSGTTTVTEEVTVYADNPKNFIFVGKGWGHGVGLSQWGVKDLANLGYEATEILSKYFTGIEILDWHEVPGE